MQLQKTVKVQIVLILSLIPFPVFTKRVYGFGM